jgi:hypothetical protein
LGSLHVLLLLLMLLLLLLLLQYTCGLLHKSHLACTGGQILTHNPITLLHKILCRQHNTPTRLFALSNLLLLLLLLLCGTASLLLLQ